MSVTIERQHNDVNTTKGVSASEDSASVRFFALTTAGEEEPAVRTAVLPLVPDFYEGLVFTRLENLTRHGDIDNVWSFEASYTPSNSSFTLPALEVNQVRWGIRSGTGATIKRKRSLGLVSESVDTAYSTVFTLAGTDAANLVGIKLGENVQTVEAIDGYDVSVGEPVITVETVKDGSTVSGGYLVAVAEWASQNAVNNATWKIFAAGTLRLVDYSATERAQTDANPADWDISMTLVYSPNLTNIVIGGAVPNVASKKGHQLLDVLYLNKKIGPASFGIPIRAAVHAWYPEVDFTSVLGI